MQLYVCRTNLIWKMCFLDSRRLEKEQNDMVTKINVILLEITEQRSSYIRKVMEDCNISKITHGTLPSSSGAMGAHVPLVGSAYYLLFLQWKGYFGTILKQHIPQRFKCRSKSIWPKYL